MSRTAKYLAVMVIVIAVLVCCTTALAASSGTCGTNANWFLDDDDALSITGSGAMTDYAYIWDVPWYDSRFSIKAISIESGITHIGDMAFNSCASVTNIIIPDTVISIGNRAFDCCSRLTNITIPENVISIGYSAFTDCDSLASITIPDSVTSIGNDAFHDCDNLATIDVSTNNAMYACLDGCLFDKAYTELICCPAGKAGAVTIPDSVTSIGDGAFNGCERLTGITIPDGVTSIGRYTIANCSSLTTITIPDSVTSIGYYAFYGCSGLTGITIPDSVTSIDRGAFSGCISLTSITIPDSVTSMEPYYVFEYCTSLRTINVGVDNGIYSSTGGFLLNKAGTELICCPPGKTGNISIPDGVTGIGASALRACSNLTGITIPDGVTSIGRYAVDGCYNLTSITIPDSITSIGYSAFNGCVNLAKVHYHGTSDEWNAITIAGGNERLTNAEIICLKVELPEHILTVPADVTRIESEAFAGLGSGYGIELSDSVTDIADDAFTGTDIVIITPEGSDAAVWAEEHDIPVIIR